MALFSHYHAVSNLGSKSKFGGWIQPGLLSWIHGCSYFISQENIHFIVFFSQQDSSYAAVVADQAGRHPGHSRCVFVPACSKKQVIGNKKKCLKLLAGTYLAAGMFKIQTAFCSCMQQETADGEQEKMFEVARWNLPCSRYVQNSDCMTTNV